MTKLNLNLIMRLTIFLFLMLFLLFIKGVLASRLMSHFQVQTFHLMSFLINFVIGASIHLIHTNVFDYAVWKLNFKIELVVFSIIILIIATTFFQSFLFSSFIITKFIQLGFNIAAVLTVSQMILGYTVLSLFLHPETSK